ncbi:hypothetical protein BDY21DRAFT_337965 [Lineolata rhizophorae]|uniref:Uncharacterized protein n=1 Tax=Lineolata rhizophorae TaxID=578093 RepID=A0A6A6P5R0_9PEZI|nr:hypothetical protein BDY21DRAFT_337965 [Lineolata rhizophorae]
MVGAFRSFCLSVSLARGMGAVAGRQRGGGRRTWSAARPPVVVACGCAVVDASWLGRPRAPLGPRPPRRADQSADLVSRAGRSPRRSRPIGGLAVRPWEEGSCVR